MNKKWKIVLAIAGVIVLGLTGWWGYSYYQSQRAEKEVIVELPLSEAINLSKNETFNRMEIGNGFIYLFVAGEVKDRATTNIKEDSVTLQGKQKIQVNTSSSLKDLKDLGMVIPSSYRQLPVPPADTNWSTVISNVFSLLFLGFIGVMISQTFLKSYSKFNRDNKNAITFADIGGVESVKTSLMEAVSFIKDQSYLKEVGAKIPKGILLSGPPGVGKTMLARAMATEAGVDFYYTTGSEFHGMFVGQAAMRVKNLFRIAKKKPSIIFIDEFDSIAARRGATTSDVGREFDHTLNQMLAEMDGFSQDAKVLVIAATNFPDSLDPAVVRPGRFDRRINVSLPTMEERKEILRVHEKGRKFSGEVSLEDIAKQTSGMSGADLSSIVNEAAIIAGKKHRTEIGREDFAEAIDKVLVGSATSGLTSKETKKLVAYHEAGHALVSSLLPNGDRVQRVSILPRGDAGGFTRLSPEEDGTMLSRRKALSILAVYLGGRLAEEIALEDVSSGAHQDLMRANQLAREMVEHYGMGKTFGLGYRESDKTVSRENRSKIDGDVEDIINQGRDMAWKILTDHRDILDRIAQRLIEVEFMEREELESVINMIQVNTKVGVEDQINQEESKCS